LILHAEVVYHNRYMNQSMKYQNYILQETDTGTL